MVDSYRVKTYRFAPATIANGSTVGATYSDSALNGEILAIAFKNSTTAGSYQFFFSGLNLEFARNTGIVSGTASQIFYPRTEISSTTSGGALAGSNIWTSQYMNSPIYYIGSGVSGARSTGEINIIYR